MFRVVIPVRYASERFPGKALAEIAGRPMVAWVYDRARASGASEVLIATDDERIAQSARALGAPVVMTSAEHQSGTDRIAEVADRCGWRDDEIVVNLQGDEPLMPSTLLDQVAATLEGHPRAAIATLAASVATLADWLDPNVVKVVTDPGGRALYFSRAPVPWNRDLTADDPARLAAARRHIGLYAYRVGALRRLARLAPTALERIERLEQLRALESGLEIRVADAREPPGADVNLPEDVQRVAAALRAQI